MDAFNRIRSLFDPARYHGWGRTRRYFEGWYFKVVNRREDRAFAFIPGIAMDGKGERHAFVQVLDGKKLTAEYHSYPAEAFRPSPEKFELRLGGNHFTEKFIRLDLPGIKGELHFSGNSRWPVRWYSPGIMGPYAFVPFMECYHGILSMDHSIAGMLQTEEGGIDFGGGRGYIEKDWGHSFPSAYIWMQSNHFAANGISFKASVARIPWLTGNFTGFISGLMIDGRLYPFTEYGGSKIVSLQVTRQKVEITFRNRKHTLSVSAPRDTATPLAAPIKGFMGGRIEESMTSAISLMLSETSTGRVIFSGEGRNGSIEISGDPDTLMLH